MKRLRLLLALVTLPAIICAAPLRILYLGDSITDGGWGNSGGRATPSEARNHSDFNHIFGHSYMMISAATLMAEKPGEYECFNRGVSGYTLSDLEATWQQNCMEMKPDVLSVLIGTNDVEQFLGSGAKDFKLKDWERRYDSLLTATGRQFPNVRIMLGSPFVAKIGWRGDAENYALREHLADKLAEITVRLATKHNATLVPFAKMFGSLTTPSKQYWIWDGIHPTPAAHKRMADLWLQCFYSKSL